MLIPAGRHRRLNELMRNIPANRHAIFLALHELALCKSARMIFVCRQDREDAISEAVLYALGQLNRYRRGRRSAVTYFGRVLRHAMMAWMNKEYSHRHLHAHVHPEHRRESLLEQGISRRMPGQPAQAGKSFCLRSASDRQRTAEALDLALEAALKVQETNGGEVVAREAAVAVGVLQQVRKRLLGRFNRICADHARTDQNPG